MHPLQIYIVRHGQTDWNAIKKIQGHADIPLNESGKQEARTLASSLKNVCFSACFSSDLKRAHETAEILISNQPEFQIQTDHRLRERSLGSWEGCQADELDKAHPKDKHDVESDHAIQLRAFQMLEEIVMNQKEGEHILVATHGGVIGNILIKLLQLDCSTYDIHIPNTSLVVLNYINQNWQIKELQNIRLP